MKHYVYFIQSGGPDSPVKIGVAKDVQARLKDLQTANAYTLKIKSIIECDSSIHAYNIENKMHRRYKRHRLHGEWFTSSILSDNKKKKKETVRNITFIEDLLIELCEANPQFEHDISIALDMICRIHIQYNRNERKGKSIRGRGDFRKQGG